MPDLNMSRRKMFDFASFPLFGFTLVTKLRNFERMNKKQFLLDKKLFDRINHHQLLNKYVLHNSFASYQTLLIAKSN